MERPDLLMVTCRPVETPEQFSRRCPAGGDDPAATRFVYNSADRGEPAGAMPSTMLDKLRTIIRRHWGFDTLRPLQEEAMRATLDGRDSLVVMPTGGGKSLCYQAPAVLQGGTTVVVSPLIALMKDQVDGLQACGVPAVQIDSTLSGAERFAHEVDLRQGTVRLLFVSPERLAMPEFCNLLRQVGVQSFAIDEAHCISHWGHDFRPEYRQMGRLKELFPGAAVHAYTATATEQVRHDVCTQLGLNDPLVLVGNFDRPNLTYRVLPRYDLARQVREVLDRHTGEGGIIYCLRRRDVDAVAEMLRGTGANVMPYHAGMSADERRAAQDAFAAEECDVIVATVAFGMGIDRSNIRFVLHVAMPKSIEHYQQETGRAGRDGLEAECVLLHSGADFVTWKSILEKSAQENNVGPEFLPAMLHHLNDIDRYCRGAVCRHRALVEYFGQRYEQPACGACDLCLGDVESVADATIVAQKILSCVARVQERFGANHVISVLRGENIDRVRSLRHDQLSTFGLLKETSKDVLRDWIYQLLSQGVLRQENVGQGDRTFPILKLNDASWEVLRKKREVRLIQLVRRKKGEKVRASSADTTSWEAVDRGLFERLRQWRSEQARQRNVAAYVVFSDATLRDMARVRPASAEALRRVYGVGEVKLRDYGVEVLEIIGDYCTEHGLARDVARTATRPEPAVASTGTGVLSATKALALKLFASGTTIDEVMEKTQRSRSTVEEYLCEHIRRTRPATLAPWIDQETYDRVAQAVRQVGTERLKPIFLALNEQVPYASIKAVVAHLTPAQGETE